MNITALLTKLNLPTDPSNPIIKDLVLWPQRSITPLNSPIQDAHTTRAWNSFWDLLRKHKVQTTNAHILSLFYELYPSMEYAPKGPNWIKTFLRWIGLDKDSISLVKKNLNDLPSLHLLTTIGIDIEEMNGLIEKDRPVVQKQIKTTQEERQALYAQKALAKEQAAQQKAKAREEAKVQKALAKAQAKAQQARLALLTCDGFLNLTIMRLAIDLNYHFLDPYQSFGIPNYQHLPTIEHVQEIFYKHLEGQTSDYERTYLQNEMYRVANYCMTYLTQLNDPRLASLPIEDLISNLSTPEGKYLWDNTIPPSLYLILERPDLRTLALAYAQEEANGTIRIRWQGQPPKHQQRKFTKEELEERLYYGLSPSAIERLKARSQDQS